MKNAVCIIGTGTEIGKTYVSCQILSHLAQSGKQVAGLKPLATGAIPTDRGYLNEDAYKLYSASNICYSLNECNPICFGPAIAPHIAAARSDVSLNAKDIATETRQTLAKLDYEHLLIEGIGGLMVPLNQEETYLDLLKYLNLPIIMVVGIKLGCLNNALLTEQCLSAHQLKLSGWIANYIDPAMDAQDENGKFLTHKLNAPLLAVNPFQQELQPYQAFYEVFK